jgi:hypothetical protein
MAGNVDVTNHVLLVVAGTVYLHAGQPEAALKCLHSSEDLECGALRLVVGQEIFIKKNSINTA